MTLEQTYKVLENLNLDHKDEIVLINLIGEYGRVEYTRGFERSDELNKEFEESLKKLN